MDRIKRLTRYLAPQEVKRRAYYFFSRSRSRAVEVESISVYETVYHCCVQKTASQWIRHIMADWRFRRYSGLDYVHPSAHWPEDYNALPLTERRFDREFPPRSAVGPLYLDYESFGAIPKPGPYRAFFVARDPRDIVVSYYFSTKNTHTARGTSIDDFRRHLDDLSLEEGLIWSIEHLEGRGLFDALRSWAIAPPSDKHEIFRYEDLTGPDSVEHFRRLLFHLDVRMPDEVLQDLLDAHGFEKMSGRSRGEENRFSHLRKGVAGDWLNYYNDRVASRFMHAAGDVVDVLGYAEVGP